MGPKDLFFALFACCAPQTAQDAQDDTRDWRQHPMLQQYRLIRQLGEGGFSEVHLAECVATGKQVALKVVFLGRRDLTPEQRRILAGEAKILRMVSHPNVIRCLEVVDAAGGGAAVIVMEALGGGEVLRQLGALDAYSEETAAQVFAQLMSGVAYLHSLGLMHRDVKPENLLLAKPAGHYAAKGRPPKVKLIDLGMAGVYRPRAPQRGCMGSPGFIAPEVVRGAPHTPAMDIYSCGVLLFVMLVGRRPWDGPDSASLQYAVQRVDAAPGLRDRRYGALGPEARGLLRWMLSDLARERPTAAQQRMAALADGRRLLGTRRAMLVMHNGSHDATAAFHRAVCEAKRLMAEAAAARGGAAVAAAAAAAAEEGEGGGARAARLALQAASGGGQGPVKRAAPLDSPRAGPAPAPGAAAGDPPPAAGGADAATAAPPPAADGPCDGGGGGGERGPERKRRKGARPSALAAAIRGSSAASLAQLAAGPEASLADVARASLARSSRVAPPPGPRGGGATAVGAPGAAAARQGTPEVRAASSPEDGSPDAMMLVPLMLERGISLPTALGRRGRRCGGGPGGGRRARAVSCSPGALQLLAAADAAQQIEILHGRGTTDDDAASALGASVLMSATPAGFHALGLSSGRGGGRESSGGGWGGAWSPGAAAQELLASFRRHRGALRSSVPLRRSLDAARYLSRRASSARRTSGASGAAASLRASLGGGGAGSALGSAAGRLFCLLGAGGSMQYGAARASAGSVAAAAMSRSQSGGYEPLLAAHPSSSCGARGSGAAPPACAGGSPGGGAARQAAQPQLELSPQRPLQLQLLQRQQQLSVDLDALLFLDPQESGPLSNGSATDPGEPTSPAPAPRRAAAATRAADAPRPPRPAAGAGGGGRQVARSAFEAALRAQQERRGDAAAALVAAAMSPAPSAHARRAAPAPPLQAFPSEEGWGLPSGLLAGGGPSGGAADLLWLQQPQESASGQAARLELQGFAPAPPLGGGGALDEVDEVAEDVSDASADSAEAAGSAPASPRAAAAQGTSEAGVVAAADGEAGPGGAEDGGLHDFAAEEGGDAVGAFGSAWGGGGDGGGPPLPRHGRNPSHVDHWLRQDWAPPPPALAVEAAGGGEGGAPAPGSEEPRRGSGGGGGRASAVAVPARDRSRGRRRRAAQQEVEEGGGGEGEGEGGNGFVVGSCPRAGAAALQAIGGGGAGREVGFAGASSGPGGGGSVALHQRRALLALAEASPGGLGPNGAAPGRGGGGALAGAAAAAGSADASGGGVLSGALAGAASESEAGVFADAGDGGGDAEGASSCGTPHAAAWISSGGRGGASACGASGKPAISGGGGAASGGAAVPSARMAPPPAAARFPGAGAGGGAGGWFDPDDFDGPSALLL
ncbi:MAG: hypothetical protein J3K34DRAFT_524685 [Monoraphidium minutum]|nr:MAG: hypothetical protein J3K34DRAFT_524685 [Monoraphidium minutum]